MIPFLENKSLGIPSPENKKVTTFPFHVFYKYEIHIQAVVHFVEGRFVISDPHLHKIYYEMK